MRSDIIARVKSVLENSAKKAAKVSGDALDYTRLKIKLYEVEDNLKNKYAEIGKAVYEDDAEADIEALCQEVGELRDSKEDIQYKLRSMQSKKTCDVCGARIDIKYDYCPKCGTKF